MGGRGRGAGQMSTSEDIEVTFQKYQARTAYISFTGKIQSMQPFMSKVSDIFYRKFEGIIFNSTILLKLC